MNNPPDRSEVGVFTTDTNLVVSNWDIWMASASGIAESEARNRSLLELFPDIESRGLLPRLNNVLAAGTVDVLAPAFHNYLIKCPTDDGAGVFDVMQQHVTLSPLREHGRIVGMVVTVQDVTARCVRERQLADQLRRDEEAIRQRATRQADANDHETRLVDALGDSRWQVRRAAAETLVAQPTRDAIARLIDIVRDRHTDLATLNASLSALTLAKRDSLPLMLDLLAHPDANVRMYTALALGNMQDARAVPGLLRCLDDADLNVRYHVIEALGRIASADAVEPLLRIVRQRDAYLAFAALDALAAIGETSAMPEVIDLIEHPELSAAAINTLAEVGNEQAAPPLAAALTRAQVPTAICYALSRIHDRLQREFGGGDLVADMVRAQMDPSAASRLISLIPQATDNELPGVARVLGWLRMPNMAGVLCELLRHAPSRRNAQDALIALGKPSVECLLPLLHDPAAETRQAAAAVLGQIGAEESVEPLTRMLNTDEPEVLVTVAGALGSIGSPSAFEALLPAFGHSNAAVRHAAVSAVNSIAHPATAARMVELLQHESSLVRECAVRVAGYFGFAECLDRVIQLSYDESAHVRRAVVEHLPYFDNQRAVNALGRALRDRDVSVRAAAARALAHVGSELSEPLLAQALHDPDGRVRYHAIQTIGTHKLRSYAPSLRTLLSDDAAMPVRIAAATALGELQDVSSADALKRAALHPEPDLACPAIIALCRMPRVDASDVLQEALSSNDTRRQLAAIEASGHQPAYLRHIQQLVRTAHDERVLSAALNTLVASGEPEAIREVIRLCAREDRRALCMSALAHAADPDVPVLAQALHDADARVRAAVVHALARMRRKTATRELGTALHDRDPGVRFAAAQALDRLDILDHDVAAY